MLTKHIFTRPISMTERVNRGQFDETFRLTHNKQDTFPYYCDTQ